MLPVTETDLYICWPFGQLVTTPLLTHICVKFVTSDCIYSTIATTVTELLLINKILMVMINIWKMRHVSIRLTEIVERWVSFYSLFSVIFDRYYTSSLPFDLVTLSDSYNVRMCYKTFNKKHFYFPETKTLWKKICHGRTVNKVWAFWKQSAASFGITTNMASGGG